MCVCVCVCGGGGGGGGGGEEQEEIVSFFSPHPTHTHTPHPHHHLWEFFQHKAELVGFFPRQPTLLDPPIAPPTDYSNIYMALKCMKDCVIALENTDVLVSYMGLLTKALEITWMKSEEMYGIIPC